MSNEDLAAHSRLDEEEEPLPSVLLLGGLGMVGINVLKYIVDFKLARFVRVVDKRVPSICDLSPAFLQALADPCVEFMQADVSVPRHVERAFTLPSASASTLTSTAPIAEAEAEAESFTIVINTAAETGYGYLCSVYEQNILEVRRRCAAAAAAGCLRGADSGCERYIEVSTAQVYQCPSNRRPVREADGVLEPWTVLARYHAAAEAYLASPACAALPWVVARLPVVYGPGDKRGLMPRLACAATYARTGERMELLWGPKLRVHTVHAQDVASALWHLVCAGVPHEVYNVVDDGDTHQGSLNALIKDLFHIDVGFHSRALSKLASVRVEQLADEANAGHMEVWNNMLRESGIPVTVVSPHLEPELLSNHALCIDNSKLKALGFTLSCPRVTVELLQDMIDYWTSMKLFPQKEVIYHHHHP